VSPLRGEKPQNWPLSKLNTGRFALRAMLPVIITSIRIIINYLIFKNYSINYYTPKCTIELTVMQRQR